MTFRIAISRGGALITIVVVGLVGSTALFGDTASARRADVGDLSPLACVGTTGVGPTGCTLQANLAGASGLATSPDGKSIYAAGTASNAVEVFSRAGDGTISPSGCVGDSASGPNVCTGVPGLVAPDAVAVSPDGKNVYVASRTSGTLSVFSRDSNGAITWMACTGTIHANVLGCKTTAWLTGAQALSVSPDGNNVYVASLNGGDVEEFSRDSTGAVQEIGCIANVVNTPQGCSANDGLAFPDGLAVSSDGDNLYVAGLSALGTYDRDTKTGLVKFAACIAATTTGSSPCPPGPMANLKGAEGVAVSPDGMSVYVAAVDSEDLETFARDKSGALTPAGCIGALIGGPDNCTHAVAFVSPTDVTVSADSRTVYVASAGSSAVVALDRTNGTFLQFTSCVGDVSGNLPACQASAGLSHAFRVVASPDGKNVYVTGSSPGTLVALARATSSAAATTTQPTTSSTRTSTTTTTKKPAVAATLVYATVEPDKHGHLFLDLKLRVAKASSAKVQLLGRHATVLFSKSVSLNKGATIVTLALAPGVSPGTHKLAVIVTSRSGGQQTLAATVLVPK